MENQLSIRAVGKKASFAEVEEIDLEYYAGLNWKESAETVEQMRRAIWNKDYAIKPDRSFAGISKLNDDRDDIE